MTSYSWRTSLEIFWFFTVISTSTFVSSVWRVLFSWLKLPQIYSKCLLTEISPSTIQEPCFFLSCIVLLGANHQAFSPEGCLFFLVLHVWMQKSPSRSSTDGRYSIAKRKLPVFGATDIQYIFHTVFNTFPSLAPVTEHSSILQYIWVSLTHQSSPAHWPLPSMQGNLACLEILWRFLDFPLPSVNGPSQHLIAEIPFPHVHTFLERF